MQSRDLCNLSTWGVGAGSAGVQHQPGLQETPVSAFAPNWRGIAMELWVREKRLPDQEGLPNPSSSSFSVGEVNVMWGSWPAALTNQPLPQLQVEVWEKLPELSIFIICHLPGAGTLKKSSLVGTFVPLHCNSWGISETVPLTRASCKR